ncbi:MAG: hypothetical protein KZQ65_12410, partial [Candidatus Thiodiazotropha sp. (ex Gloverina cf. vestifex)]|nr:hypothetical protein [Candidatus Thiodiazotropha sp. (ex Gloverina cf. vestifex)]
MLEEIHLNISPGVFSDDLPEPARKFFTNLVSEIEGSLDALQAHTFESSRQMEKGILNNAVSYFNEQIHQLSTQLSSQEGMAIMGEVNAVKSGLSQPIEVIKEDIAQIKKDIANVNATLK